MILNRSTFPKMVDISCVRANNTLEELRTMVRMVREHQFICCFSMPCFTGWLAEELKDERTVIIGGAVGFPSGAASTATKIQEVEEQKRIGCREFDVVMNIGALKSGLYDLVEKDIRAVVEAASGKPVKTIIEVTLLSDEEIKKASEIAVHAGTTFIKTGTGWTNKPTTPEHIRLIKSAIGNQAYIKAAGGVSTVEDVVSLINEGCSRFGISLQSTMNILEQLGDRNVECADVDVLY